MLVSGQYSSLSQVVTSQTVRADWFQQGNQQVLSLRRTRTFCKFTQCSSDDIHLVHDSITFPNPRSLGSVEPDGMDFIHEGETSVLVGDVAELLQRRDVTSHGVDGFEGYDLGLPGIGLLQELLQVLHVIVAEHMLRNAAVADALDHRGVVASIREDLTACMIWDMCLITRLLQGQYT